MVRRVASAAVLTGLGLAAAPGCAGAAQASDDAGLRSLGAVPLYPLAGGPLDLLSNNVVIPLGGTQLSTVPVTAPFQDGLLLRDVPVAGSLLS
ncbi:hypothetical protein [Catenulispora subtropica]|uniref:hypothetical protein n=1 Tax=Catenulispora subtropica TaxID=450798 RepID=UPI0031DD0F0E